jgi:TctA family transporter
MAELTPLDLLGYFFAGLSAVLNLNTFFALCAGIFMGFWVGILPGVGGPATLALLIPFTFGMEPFSAFALLLGMISVASTAGDITAILFGIPGESANAASVEDGSPMAKRGEAGRALGASLMASLLGGTIGALFLAIAVVLIRPLVLSVGYAEFFMMSLAGIAFLASLSSRAVLKGLAGGAFGLLLACVGMSTVTATERFTFGALSLWEGLGFIPAILGLFAIPELIELAAGKSRLPATERRITNSWQGIKDALRHFGIVFRCSILSTYIGILPGMGASIAQWVAYGHAVRSVKDKQMIGRGAVEGVIGPGAACAATMSGSLVPTIGFGVPGSPQMAILLGAFIIQGLVPGPSMLTPEESGGHLTLTFSMVWMIVLSNLIVVAACLPFLSPIAKIAYLDAHILFPFILVLIFVGGFTSKNELLDLWICLAFGILGWAMVQWDWPRPPLILGLVLGALIEDNLFLTLQAYGMSWVTFPSVIGIFAIIALTIVWPYFKPYWSKRRGGSAGSSGKKSEAPRNGPRVEANASKTAGPIGDIVLSLIFGLVFLTAILISTGFPFSAALMPIAAAAAGLLFATGQALVSIRTMTRQTASGGQFRLRWMPPIDHPALAVVSAYLVFFALLYVFGFAAATAIFLMAYLIRFAGKNPITAAPVAVATSVTFYYGFQRVLQIPFPEGLVLEYGVPWIGSALTG